LDSASTIPVTIPETEKTIELPHVNCPNNPRIGFSGKQMPAWIGQNSPSAPGRVSAIGIGIVIARKF